MLDLSEEIMKRLEETELFRQASCIALYNAIPGEVQTAGFLEKWFEKKQLLLPLTVDESEIDLIIVPGVAFDRQLNRMGRGKGYYDRLLSTLQAPKIGICFDFQLQDTVPTESFDKKMDMIITEKEIVNG